MAVANIAVCDPCWTARWPATQEPYRMAEDVRPTENCGYCGVESTSGIYAVVDDAPAGDRPVREPPVVLICAPRKDCADPHVLRWHCMRGHDGAPDGVCPLEVCDQRGANRTEQVATDG